MFYFLLGIILLGIVLYLLNRFKNADPAKLVNPIRFTGGVICLLLSAFLSMRGLYIISAPLGIFGLGLIFGRRYGYSNLGRRPRGPSGMTEKEALDILGLEPGAGKAEILKAHKNKMKENHPDRGGSEEEAKKINMAKDFLIGKIS